MYEVWVFYPGKLYSAELDERITWQARKERSGSGMGLPAGERDLSFACRTLSHAKRMANRLKSMKIPGLKVEVK